ncbi:hypothetical protein Cgig2_007696 [Carnegiea gigantea]|uniref:Uncharacterized protein n=1 Tax=Carnegiea gigantea TaxID=171969 RepID=A0A9Q1JGD9_9CARY|nr:hypothetical protein Cgig2_007696 [Carnegiea gigantea]
MNVRQDHKTQPRLFDQPQNPNPNPTASASVAATVKRKRNRAIPISQHRRGVVLVCHALLPKVIFVIFFILKPLTTANLHNPGKKTMKRVSPCAATSVAHWVHESLPQTRFRLIYTTVVSILTRFMWIEDHGCLLVAVEWQLCIILIFRGTVAVENHRWKKVRGKNSKGLHVSLNYG